MKKTFDENTKRQIERLYILLRESVCDARLLSKLKMEVESLWQHHKDSLDVKTLYFLFWYKTKVQEEKDVLSLFTGEELGFPLLRDIDDMVTGKVENTYEEIKNKKEVSEIVHNCIYSDLDNRFDSVFYRIDTSFETLRWMETDKDLNNIKDIINYFKFSFTTEPEYKNKILFIFDEKIKKLQNEITENKIKWCNWGEKQYNKCFNLYLSDFWKQIHCEKEAPIINLKFQKGWNWIHSSDENTPLTMLLLFLATIIVLPLVGVFSLAPIEKITTSLIFLLPTLSIGIGVAFYPSLITIINSLSFEKNKKQINNYSMSLSNNIDEIINQAVDVLNNIPKNEKTEALSDKIQKYQVLLKDFNSLNAPTSLSSLNVYLTIFLNNIIDKKEKLSLEDLNLADEAFSTANNILLNQTEQNKVKELESKHLELEIAKREIDFLAKLNLNQEFQTKVK